MAADDFKSISIKPSGVLRAGLATVLERMRAAEPWREVQPVEALRRMLYAGLVAEGAIAAAPDKGGLSEGQRATQSAEDPYDRTDESDDCEFAERR